MRKGLLIFTIFIVMLLYFVVADILNTSDTPSYNPNEDVTNFYNISINNTNEIEGLNFTQVNITFPSDFTINSSTNGTDASGNLIISGQTISWTNNTDDFHLVLNGTSKYFWINATAPTPGSYSITITTLDTSSNTNSSTVSVTINDTTNPSVTLNSPSNNSKDTNGEINFECTGNDNGELNTAKLYVWDSNNNVKIINTTLLSGISDQASFENTLTDGNYKWNCFVNDTSGNSDWDINRTLIVNISTSTTTTTTTTTNNTNNTTTNETTGCTPNWECTSWIPEDECPQNESRTRTCTDTNNCGTNEGKPEEEKSCSFGGLSTTAMITISIIAITILIVGGVLFYIMKRKSLDEMTVPEDSQNQFPTGNQGTTNYQNTQSSPRFY